MRLHSHSASPSLARTVQSASAPLTLSLVARRVRACRYEDIAEAYSIDRQLNGICDPRVSSALCPRARPVTAAVPGRG